MPSEFEKEVRHFLGPRGQLRRLLPGYEDRPEQAELAAAALNALERAGILMVEAGTGTGKTLAYLTPVIYAARRVVISTGTKALQEQLLHKDLPVLQQMFDIRAEVMKGRTNYLCWHRFHEFSRAPEFNFRDEVSLWDRIREWAGRTRTGDRAEIPGLPDQYSTWRELSATSEQCLGQKCEYVNECFLLRLRARAQSADIVIVNHHLFFADLALRDDAYAAVLPEYHAVIFDEAHGLAETAAEFFGMQVSTWRVQDLSQDIRRLQRAGQMEAEELRTLLRQQERAEEAAGRFFRLAAENGAAGEKRNGEGARFSLLPLKNHAGFLEEGERAAAELRTLAAFLSALGAKDDSLRSLGERAEKLARELVFILEMEDQAHVFWGETRGRGVILRASPAELGPILTERLFARQMPIIFTSATLAVREKRNWSFAHFRREVGLEECGRAVKELWLPSSYEWERQAILYVPRHLPDPLKSGFIAAAGEEIKKLLAISRGRAFLLFTSFRHLEAAYDLLAGDLPYPALKQGDAPKSELLAQFRQQPGSVLFATHSFWEGVDVAGPALSAVIIDKLPFAAPGDPLTAARIERLRRRGGNPFQEYQLPAAILHLKQGLGRLLRSRTDYGLLAVLDSRLYKKNYGRAFLQSIPVMPLTSNLSEVEEFFRRHEKGGEG